MRSLAYSIKLARSLPGKNSRFLSFLRDEVRWASPCQPRFALTLCRQILTVTHPVYARNRSRRCYRKGLTMKRTLMGAWFPKYNITDKTESSIPGATVIATAQATGQARTTNPDGAGRYLLPLLPVGIYTVHVDATGFQSAESKDLNLQIDEARELDFALVPGTVVTTVAVTGDAVAVESSTPSLGQVITSQEVAQLPLNGRDFVQLATLTSGATAETNPNSFFTSAASSEV